MNLAPDEMKELENPAAQKKSAGWQGDAQGLAAALREHVRGEVSFDTGSRALYATDASNYRQVPVGVVIPKDADDVAETVAVCHSFDVPVLPRGGGTSLAGQCCNIAVVMDMTKYMNRVLEINPGQKIARVQPGTVLDELRTEARKHNLTFGPDPATHSHCTLGGMVGNNSCGIHSVMAGRTVENVESLEILTYDGLRLRVGQTAEAQLEEIIAAGGRRGEIYADLKKLRDRYALLIRERYPPIPRLISGYGLQHLLPENGFHVARALVGTEGTCATILEATLRLVDSHQERALLVLGYADVYAAADHVPEILTYSPIGLEGIDEQLVDYMRRSNLYKADLGLLPEGRGWLVVEFGAGEREVAHAQARRLMDALKKKDNPPSMKIYEDAAQEKRIWSIRESALGATAKVPGMDDTWPGWEDAAVPPERLGGYLRDFRRLLQEHNYECSLYGHFGQGCVHVSIDFDLRTRAGIDTYLHFINAAADLVVSYGGSFSGEHGDGQSRASLLPKMFGEDLVQAFREFKAIWDPQGRMNPGKIVDPYRPEENLRLGVSYAPWEPETVFGFPEDQGSFARTALRCVGVGECRRKDGGTMCPSYMVTLEEKHSTRGRSRLLFEMLNGQVIGKNRWKDEAVRDALDLCLACKGCKSDCPVNVDMATYKAEFLSHYYQGRFRPPSAYVFSLIYWWARVGSLTPALVNFFLQSEFSGNILKTIINVAPQRKFPTFAGQTFKDWYRKIEHRNPGSPQVVLWADTFNNHFHPEILQAALKVLEDAGYHVRVTEESLCCGRPLHDSGMLGQAKKQLGQILTTLKPYIRAGIPLVSLEPSCTSVFRDDLTNLFTHDEDARRLKQQTFTLAELLDKHTQGYEPPRLECKAVVHAHCHHKAIMRMFSEEAILKKMGMDYEILDSGCCGMAGAFGLEKGEHYDVSVKAGERVLLPAVRNAPSEAIIIADGFSCREQISQMTDRHALHLAEVILLALSSH